MALDHGPGVPRRLADSLRALADWMRIPGLLRGPIAAAAVLTVFAVVVWAPAWAQAPAPATPEKTWETMGADSEVRPGLQGYLLDNGDFTIYDPFNEIAVEVSADPHIGCSKSCEGSWHHPFPSCLRATEVRKGDRCR